MKQSVLNGCDLLNSRKSKDLLLGKRIGLITNTAALLKTGETTAYHLNNLYNLRALFAPEHGFKGLLQAGGHEKTVIRDTNTQVNIYDLFGGESSLEQAEVITKELDALVFDIQDIGTRYYTYQYTMLDGMMLSKKVGIPFIVLDRINPLGFSNAKGNCLETNCISEVGRVSGQPTFCGITIGELARWYNIYLNINTELHIIPCENLNRQTAFENTDLNFTPPSPNMRNLNALFLYGATCLFEGVNISEGRGTIKPFELFGAPWIEPKKVFDYLTALSPKEKNAFGGIDFKPCEFTPTFSDYKNEKCYGLELIIKDKKSVNTFTTGLILIKTIRELYPDKFEATEHLANLSGTKEILKPDFEPIEYSKKQKPLLRKFDKEVKEYLIYE